MKDYYAILGCKPDTPQADIIKHARRAATEVNEAYRVLNDPVARAEYDKSLIKPIPPKTRQPRFVAPPKPSLNLKELQTAVASVVVLIVVVVFLWNMLFSNKPAVSVPKSQHVVYFDKNYAIYKCESKIIESSDAPTPLQFEKMEFTTVNHPKDENILVHGINGQLKWHDNDKKSFVCVVIEDTNFSPSRYFVKLVM